MLAGSGWAAVWLTGSVAAEAARGDARVVGR